MLRDPLNEEQYWFFTKASHRSTSYNGQKDPDAFLFHFPLDHHLFYLRCHSFFLKQHPIMSACPKAIIPFIPFFCPPFSLPFYLNNLLFPAMEVPHWLSSEPLRAAYLDSILSIKQFQTLGSKMMLLFSARNDSSITCIFQRSGNPRLHCDELREIVFKVLRSTHKSSSVQSN